MSCTIRPMRRDDTDKLIELRRQSLRSDPDFFYRAEEETYTNHWANFLNNKNVNYTICAEDAGHLIGCASLQKHNLIKIRHKFKLVFLYVEPSRRRLGVGTGMMSSIASYADMLRMQIVLTLLASNISAKDLYRKFNFIEFGREPLSVFAGNEILESEIYMKRFPGRDLDTGR